MSGAARTRLVVLEPDAEGHRMHYVRHIAAEAVARGHELELVTRRSTLDHPAYALLEQSLGSALHTTTLPEVELPLRVLRGGDLPRSQLRHYVEFRRFFRSRPPEPEGSHLLVPFVDHCDKLIGLLGDPFGGREWSGLSLGIKFHDREVGVSRPFRADDPIERVLYRRMLAGRRLRALLTVDRLLPVYTARRLPRLAHKLHYVPDPIELDESVGRDEARERLGLEDEVVVLVYGMLEARKGIGHLLEAVARGGLGSELVVLLAGTQRTDVLPLLASPTADELRSRGRLRELEGFLDARDEASVFRAADIGWVGYEGFYRTSGVLLQFARMGVPVVACREGMIGWITRRFEIGLDVEPSDRTATAAGLRALANDRELAARLGANGRELAREHTTERFAGRVCDAIGIGAS